jgi:phosphate-selective porin
MDHRLEGESHVTTGWYALASWRLGGALQSLRPYLLLDRLDVANEEPYLSDVPDQRAWSAGVRWDAAAHVVLKFDYQSQRARQPEEERRARVQLAVAF